MQHLISMVHRVGGKGASQTKASSTKEASTNTKSERLLREPWLALVLASSVGKVCAPWCSVAWCLLVVIVSLLGMTLSFCEQWSPCNRWSSFQTCEFPKTWSENCMQNTVSRRSWNRFVVDFNPISPGMGGGQICPQAAQMRIAVKKSMGGNLDNLCIFLNVH